MSFSISQCHHNGYQVVTCGLATHDSSYRDNVHRLNDRTIQIRFAGFNYEIDESSSCQSMLSIVTQITQAQYILVSKHEGKQKIHGKHCFEWPYNESLLSSSPLGHLLMQLQTNPENAHFYKIQLERIVKSRIKMAEMEDQCRVLRPLRGYESITRYNTFSLCNLVRWQRRAWSNSKRYKIGGQKEEQNDGP